ncbi:MAG: prepilin-type N-terminal cleavage/methylation domain-containing protein [Thermodesulfobacteriota bacterium]
MNMKASRTCIPYTCRRNQGLPAGFTLLEILVAIFIFGVVATTIFGSYRFIFSTSDAFENGITIHEAARNCLNRMTADLQSAYVSLPPAYTPPKSGAAADPYRFSGEIETVGSASFSRLRFASLAHVALEKNTRQGIAEIVYYVQTGADGMFILRRSDTLYPYKPFQEQGTDPILCENLKSLKFTYYDNEGDDSNRWDSDSEDFRYTSPRAVGIQLGLGSGSVSQRFEALVALPAYRPKAE